jgi:hypothetical protein
MHDVLIYYYNEYNMSNFIDNIINNYHFADKKMSCIYLNKDYYI